MVLLDSFDTRWVLDAAAFRVLLDVCKKYWVVGCVTAGDGLGPQVGGGIRVYLEGSDDVDAPGGGGGGAIGMVEEEEEDMDDGAACGDRGDDHFVEMVVNLPISVLFPGDEVAAVDKDDADDEDDAWDAGLAGAP